MLLLILQALVASRAPTSWCFIWSYVPSNFLQFHITMASPGNALLDLLRQSAANSGSASSTAAAPASTDSGAGLLAMLTASAARQQVGVRYTTSPPLSVLLPTLDQTVSLSVQYTVSTFCIQHV